MARIPDEIRSLIRGALLKTGDWPLILTAQPCDLRSRFILKRRVGRSYHAVSRNGRVLLVSDRPLEELAGTMARLRLQTWHKVILPGEPPGPWGILLGIRGCEVPTDERLYLTRLAQASEVPCDLAVDVGGGTVLEFSRKELPRPGS